MPLVIRTAEPTIADAAVLVALNVHVQGLHVVAEPEYYAATNDEELERWFESRLRAADHLALVAERDGEPVGYALLRCERRPAHEFGPAVARVLVDQLAVAATVQREGIGRALMEQVHGLAAREGFSRVELDVREHNHGARAFYEALGYETAARRLVWRP